MKRAILLLFLFAAILCQGVTFSFAEEEVIKEYTFTSVSNDKDFSYTDNPEIEESGVKYTVKDIKYDVLDEKADEITRELTDLKEKKVPDQETVKGTKYTLKNVQYEEKEITQEVTASGDISQEDIPKETQITSGGTSFTGKLTKTEEHVSETYDVPFLVSGTFYGGSEVYAYDLNGISVPAASAPGFNGYEKAVLSYLGLNADMYRIDTASWSGGEYTASTGEAARDATFGGMRRGITYVSTYTAAVYEAKAVYENAAGKSYTVKATVTYVPAEPEGLSFTAKLFIGAAVAMATLAAALILFVLAKKRKKEQEA